MADQWLTLEEAARRVHRSRRTIERWTSGEQPRLRVFNGLVMVKHLLDVDKAMRSRVGRPKGQRVPLVVGGREVGHITIGPDGAISGRMNT